MYVHEYAPPVNPDLVSAKCGRYVCASTPCAQGLLRARTAHVAAVAYAGAALLPHATAGGDNACLPWRMACVTSPRVSTMHVPLSRSYTTTRLCV